MQNLSTICEGLAEDVITGLGRFRSLFVIDRHSSSTIAKLTSDTAEIGRRLGVTLVVRGNLQRQADRIRITVRLVDTSSRAQTWGDVFDIASADVLSVPDRITAAIVATLHGRAESSLVEQSRRQPALGAYECVLSGIKHLRGYGPDDNQRAVDLFQRAIDLDRGYGLARAYRAFAELVLRGYDGAPAGTLLAVKSMAQEAVELDPDDARCH